MDFAEDAFRKGHVIEKSNFSCDTLKVEITTRELTDDAEWDNPSFLIAAETAVAV